MTQPWLMFGLAVVTMIVSVGGSLIAIGMFSGRISEALKNQSQALERVAERMDDFQTFTSASGADRADLNARLIAVEREAGRLLQRDQESGERMARVESAVDQCRRAEEQQSRRMDEVFVQMNTIGRQIMTRGDQT